MPSYPADSVVHILNERSCSYPSCKNSKLKGAAMKRCAQCQTVYYCSPACQRADWPQHKRWCRKEVDNAKREQSLIDKGAIRPGVAEDFDAWFAAMGAQLFIWICVHGLEIYKDPTNIQTKFVHLALRERRQRSNSPLKLFEYVKIEVYDRHLLPIMLPDFASELVEQYREYDEQAKGQGKAGVALLITGVAPPEGTVGLEGICRTSPVILQIDDVNKSEDIPQWKDLVKDIIDNGRSIKRMMAERQQLGI
ncbi:MSS51-like protein, mitochondrial [Mycena venus]|uniref:MSS51-like protein, mitochondrial n=1 Tax=Mycena venus TaxID=2733690 RepID=A0A8H6WX31_9AGAR|nr:MSS51-like protein, mitochondrial [Mycena venus]